MAHWHFPADPRRARRESWPALVDRVTFHNTENGFCVLPFKPGGQRGLISVVGHAAMISAGEFLQARRPGQ
jgi:exodeoxyribonuclease V alpha subunit